MSYGKYYSKNLTISEADSDLFTQVKTNLSLTNLTAKKLTLITQTAITIDINNTGVFSDLFLDSDGYYKLSFSEADVLVSSLKVHESSGTVFLAIIY